LNNKSKNPSPDYICVWQLPDDYASNFSRSIQEKEILKTRLNKSTPKGPVLLPSFEQVWKESVNLRKDINKAEDKHEAKWGLSKKYNYKLATTFMPEYAKSIYEYFGASRVLDPCAGWGDRLIGAALSSCVEKYVAFDPNVNLRQGYIEEMSYMNQPVDDSTERSLVFQNGYEIHLLPFEIGIRHFQSESFDLAFTSPPFFDYEVYSESNPSYRDWIKEFYEPLFIEVARCLVNGGRFCLHMGDTNVGSLREFLMEKVAQIVPMKYEGKIGLTGAMSNKVRDVYVFQKIVKK
jgi:tRNA1(Val) A37 N6-methylase TrmN6